MKIAPGCRLSRWTTFCASTGRLRICSRDITLPTLASVVFRCVVSDTTLTVSAMPPTSRMTVSRVTVSTCRLTRSTTAVLKPVSSTFSVVETRLHVAQPEAATFIGGRDLRGRGRDVRHGHGRAGDHLLLCIRDFTDQCGGSGLGMCGASREQGSATTQTASSPRGQPALAGFVKASSRKKQSRQFVPAPSVSTHEKPRLVTSRCGLKMALYCIPCQATGRAGSCASAVVAATAVGIAQQQPTFRSGVDLVTVDAAVLDGDGQPVPTLQADDFRIEVDGRPRRIVSAQFVDQSRFTRRVAVAVRHAFQLERWAATTAGSWWSRSMRRISAGSKAGRRSHAASRFIDGLPAIDRIGVIGLTSCDSASR